MGLFYLLFVWCPLLGILIYALYLSYQEEVGIGKIWALAVMLSLYLGGLAVTKELLGDFLTYNQYFQDVPKYSLVAYLLLSYSILKIGVALNTSINNLLLALFFMAFFFQEFVAIGNMLRQGLANQ